MKSAESFPTLRTSPRPREVLMNIMADSFDRTLAKKKLSPEDRASLLDYRFQFETCLLPIVNHLRFDFMDDLVDSDNWVGVLMRGCFNAGLISRQTKAKWNTHAKDMRDKRALNDQPRELAIWEAIREVVKAKGVDVSRFDGSDHDGANKAASEIEDDVNILLKKTGFTCEVTAIKRRLRKMCAPNYESKLSPCSSLSKSAVTLSKSGLEITQKRNIWMLAFQ
ncbi:MAG TPA: hypothetical protein VIL70_04325 [Chthoniobacterales bacterium]